MLKSDDRIWEALPPRSKSFVCAFVMGAPAYTKFSIEDLPKDVDPRYVGRCVWTLTFKARRLILSRYRVQLARTQWNNEDTLIHEFAHALEHAVNPRKKPDPQTGAPDHDPAWGSAYSVCYALWCGELRSIVFGEGLTWGVNADTGMPVVYLPKG